MITISLCTFAAEVSISGHISFSNVEKLQRDILPDGIGSREEAELLLTLDRGVKRADRSFTDWLVAALVDFVVWGARPTGYVDAETARWLAPLLRHGGTRVSRLLAQELIREAQGVDEALLSSLMGNPKRRPGTTGFQRGTVPLAA